MAAPNPEDQSFVVQITSFTIFNKIYPSHRTQITLLKVNESSITVSPEYSNFKSVFFPELTTELPKHIRINNHIINLVDGKKLSNRPYYSLGLIELETLKTYVGISLVNGFIKLSKFLTDILIL